MADFPITPPKPPTAPTSILEFRFQDVITKRDFVWRKWYSSRVDEWFYDVFYRDADGNLFQTQLLEDDFIWLMEALDEFRQEDIREFIDDAFWEPNKHIDHDYRLVSWARSCFRIVDKVEVAAIEPVGPFADLGVVK